MPSLLGVYSHTNCLCWPQKAVFLIPTSKVSAIISMCHHAWLFSLFLFAVLEIKSKALNMSLYHLTHASCPFVCILFLRQGVTTTFVQAGLRWKSSCIAGMIGAKYHAWPGWTLIISVSISKQMSGHRRGLFSGWIESPQRIYVDWSSLKYLLLLGLPLCFVT
jgi:hypothetical protein